MNYVEKFLLNLVRSSKESGVNFLISGLLKSGMSPNLTIGELGNISLLMVAISIKNIKLAKELVAYGADINYENNVLSRCIIADFLEGFTFLISQPKLSKESVENALFISLLREERIIYTNVLVFTFRELCLNAKNKQKINVLSFSQKAGNQSAVKLFERFFAEKYQFSYN